MQFLSIILSLLLILVISPLSLLSANADSDGKLSVLLAGDKTYEIEPFHYKGNIAGYEVDFEGTIEEIYAQMEERYPSFSAEKYVNESAAQTLAVRDTEGIQSKGKTYCCPVPGHGWTWTRKEFVNRGISYLKGITGGPCGVNPHKCARISCSWGAAIYLCSDHDSWFGPQCPYMATYAEDLVRDCGLNELKCCGQKFDTDNYNIIVRNDDC